MTTPDPRHAALVLGLLDVFAKRTAELSKQARSIAVTDYFRPGERTIIVDPVDGRTLGKVWMTDPKAVAEVFDDDAFRAHVAEAEPEGVDTVTTLIGDDEITWHEALAVLRKHAPHLVREYAEIRDWARKAVLDRAVKGEPTPGVEVRTKRGAMTVKLDPGAAERYRELVAQGAVDPLAELPAASVEGRAA